MGLEASALPDQVFMAVELAIRRSGPHMRDQDALQAIDLTMT